ncbi:unnamed protein product [Callosobruchus maculatus]|uniref:Uncharacterized protein n=1 Tax=Callosobruchus maculatus TaxID=64391 RepID=A0A653DS35_CALMS|nr:unnamed protein product [Callosobruchus maculatus]
MFLSYFFLGIAIKVDFNHSVGILPVSYIQVFKSLQLFWVY